MWIEALSKKVRFEFKGLISIEDLFDLSLKDLDEIYRKLKKEMDEYKQYSADSLLDKDDEKDETYEELQLKIDIVTAVFDYINETGVGREQAAIVKNAMSGLKVNHEVEEVLDEQGYAVAGRLPRCNTLLRNIASGDKWDKYLRENQRAEFVRMYENLWKAYMKMAEGKFTELWNK